MQFKIYRVMINEECQSITIEAPSEIQALALAEEDTNEHQIEDWKDEYNDNNGWDHLTEDQLLVRNHAS